MSTSPNSLTTEPTLDRFIFRRVTGDRKRVRAQFSSGSLKVIERARNKSDPSALLDQDSGDLLSDTTGSAGDHCTPTLQFEIQCPPPDW